MASHGSRRSGQMKMRLTGLSYIREFQITSTISLAYSRPATKPGSVEIVHIIYITAGSKQTHCRITRIHPSMSWKAIGRGKKQSLI